MIIAPVLRPLSLNNIFFTLRKCLLKTVSSPGEVLDTLKLFCSARREPRKIDVLFICHEANLNLFYGDAFLSRLVDPLAMELEAKGYSCEKYLWQRISRDGILHSSYNKTSIGICFARPWLASFFLRRILRPRLVISIPVPSCLKHACDCQGIPTLELFHGFGIGFSDWMWSINRRVETGAYFVAFDQQTAQTLLANKSRYFEVIRCSHPYLAVDQLPGRCLPNPFSRKKLSFGPAGLSATPHLEAYNSQAPCVLFTLQHGYDGSYEQFKNILPNGIMHDTLISLIKDRIDLNWLIKPHPVQLSSSESMRALFRFLDDTFSECSNVFYLNSHLFDPVDLLRLCSVHVTMASSTVVEAYLLQIHSLCLCPTLKPGGVMQEAFASVRRDGFFHHASLDSASISNALDRILMMSSSGEVCYREFRELESLLPSSTSACEKILSLKTGG
jgi:hypothetical protein